MTIDSPTDKAACPTDEAHSREASQACGRILAENSATARGSSRPPETRPAGRSIDVSTHGLYPHDRNGTKVHPAAADRTFDARPHGSDSTAHSPRIWESIEYQREALLKQAGKELPEKEVARLKKDMDEFEKRAKAKHLPDSEVYRTYASALRLLNGAVGATSVPNMQRLAEQVINQAAHPENVRQGNNDTCEMASMEFVLYSKNPSVVADVVAQSAIRGSYKTKDGIEVAADPEPTYASDHYRRSNGDRTYASQIFQTTAINVGFAEDGGRYEYHAEKGRVPDGKPQKGGYVYDYQTGNRLNYWNSDDVYATKSYFGMTGKSDLIIVNSGHPNPDYPNIRHANTPAQFNQIMRDLKKNDQFPVMVGVDLQNQPFWEDGWQGGHDPKKRYKTFDGHDLAVTDFRDGALPTVSVHNNWSPDADHKAMSAHELFLATRPARQNLADLQRQYDASVAQGNPNYMTALDILRLKAGFRQIGPDELRTELMKDLKGIVDQHGVAITSIPYLRDEYNEIANIVQAQGGADPAQIDPELWRRIMDFLNNARSNQ